MQYLRRLFVILALAAPVAAGEKAANIPDLPKAVSSFGAVASDGYVYLYGGHAGKSHTYDTTTVLGTFHRCKLEGGPEWEALPRGPILQGMNLAAHGGNVYLVGGMQPRNAPGEKHDNHSVTDVLKYDPAKKAWEKMPSLPAGRSSHDAVVAGNKLVVVGGWQMNGKDAKSAWHDTTLTLDLSQPDAKWESVKQPFQRRALTAAVQDGKVYVIAGLNADAESLRTVDVLDVSTGKWTQGPDLPGEEKVGFSPAACTVDGRVVVNTSEGPLYRLNAKGDAWEKVGAVEKTRIVHRIVPAADGSVLVLGGAGKGGNVAEVERIKPTATK